MLRYIFKRVLLMIPVIIGVITVVFIINALTPADPAAQILGAGATQEQITELRQELGLDDPFFVRYGNYLWDLLHGDMGRSYVRNEPVWDEIVARFPVTFKLAVLSMIVAVLIGIPIGIISALRRYSFIDSLTMTISLIGVSAPGFWLALLLMLIFCVHWHIFPTYGLSSWMGWVLPVIALSFSSLAQIARNTRSSMLEAMNMDYIRTARAKGQKEITVISKHMLRNAIIPIINIVGMMFGMSLGGAVLIESIFSIPGLGKYMVDAIMKNDYPAVQGSVLYLAVVFSIVSLIIDILFAAADPRIKAQFKAAGAKKHKIKTAVAAEGGK